MSTLVGNAAPQFQVDAVHHGEFKSVSLADFKGKWLVVFFYPLDFTFVCPTEILAFSDRVKDFQNINAEIVGVSIDSKFTHLAWTEKDRKEGGIKGIQYPLLADLNRKMAQDFGVLSADGVALRGLFIIDTDGIIQHATVNNLSVGRSVDETLRVLQAFQFVREHGEVCPADWKPGADSMKAHPTKSKQWFNKHGAGTVAAAK
ncbi:MAG TPA: peroxiredoxin [Tepidisphaeraceae bacterium]|jgi:peroxiredoxin (alkyl hydroperoxide reductase subunit C)